MTNEELFSNTVLNSWKLVVGRFDQNLAALTDDQLQQHVAPGKNRLVYILGHLAAVHDRLIPMLGLGERLHPEFEEPFITNPDGAKADTIPASEIRKAWSDINSTLTSAFEKFTPQEWLQKHTAVSDEDFAKDPSRNRLAVVLNRTNHLSMHSGQAVLAK